MWKGILMCGTLVTLVGCSLVPNHDEGFYVFNYSVDFNISADNWSGDFADYPAGEYDSIGFELETERTQLPSNLGANRKGLKVSGNNYNDDLFMFIKRKVSGLDPYTDYTIVFGVELASNAPTGTIDSEGPDDVFLKVGAVPMEPKKVIEGNHFRMNIDKGNQGQGGEDMMVIGNIAAGPNTSTYAMIERNNTANNAPRFVRTNSKGELWLIVGTDSSFKGLTTLYYTKVDVIFSRSN
jgi:hypothetical protein